MVEMSLEAATAGGGPMTGRRRALADLLDVAVGLSEEGDRRGMRILDAVRVLLDDQEMVDARSRIAMRP